MKKRIRKKKQKQFFELYDLPIATDIKYHCDKCNMNLVTGIRKSAWEESLEYLRTHKVLCPICKNELKQIEQ